jgi:hypothetical protein
MTEGVEHIRRNLMAVCWLLTGVRLHTAAIGTVGARTVCRRGVVILLEVERATVCGSTGRRVRGHCLYVRDAVEVEVVDVPVPPRGIGSSVSPLDPDIPAKSSAVDKERV